MTVENARDTTQMPSGHEETRQISQEIASEAAQIMCFWCRPTQLSGDATDLAFTNGVYHFIFTMINYATFTH